MNLRPSCSLTKKLTFTCSCSFRHVSILFYMHWCFACMSVWGCRIPWNWNHRQLWAFLWVLGIEPRSSGRTASVLNHWSISPVPTASFSLWVLFVFARCHYIALAGLKLRDLPASASWVLALKVCAITPGRELCFVSLVIFDWAPLSFHLVGSGYFCIPIFSLEHCCRLLGQFDSFSFSPT